MPDPEQSEASEAEVAKTVTLTRKDMRDAARLFRLLADPVAMENGLKGIFPLAEEPGTDTVDRHLLNSRARVELYSRRVRKRYFRTDLFGEPAWEILLALYITELAATRLSISMLAEWIEAPLSTVLRWVRTLEEDSLIGRVDHPTDRRIVFIRLLDKGRKALDAYLGALPD